MSPTIFGTNTLNKIKPSEIDEIFEANDKNDLHLIKLKLVKVLLEEFDSK